MYNSLIPNVQRLSKVTIVSGEQEIVSIEAISPCFYRNKGTLLQRTKILFILCWAATVHKAQGLSLDAPVMDFGFHLLDSFVYVKVLNNCQNNKLN